MSRNYDEGKGFRALAKEIQEAIDKLESGGMPQSVAWNDILSKPSVFPPDAHEHDAAYSAVGHNHDASYSGLGHNHDSAYAAVAHNHDEAYDAAGSSSAALASALAADFSGAYGDLTGTPTLGDAAAKNTGTGAGDVAAGDHTHAGGGSALDAYPVGAVYISSVSTSPATLFGGTWTALENVFLVAAKAADPDFAPGSTGGARTVTLTAAQSGLPQHTHIQDAHAHVENLNSATTGSLRGATPDTSTNTSTASGYSTATTVATNQNAGPTNAAQAHTNLPPFKAFYMWERTA